MKRLMGFISLGILISNSVCWAEGVTKENMFLDIEQFASRTEYAETCVGETACNMVDYIRIKKSKTPVNHHASFLGLILEKKKPQGSFFNHGLELCDSFKHIMNNGYYKKESFDDRITSADGFVESCHSVAGLMNIDKNEFSNSVNTKYNNHPYLGLLSGLGAGNLIKIPALYQAIYSNYESAYVHDFIFKGIVPEGEKAKVKPAKQYQCKVTKREHKEDKAPLEKLDQYIKSGNYQSPLAVSMCGWGLLNPSRRDELNPMNGDEYSCGAHAMVLVGTRIKESGKTEYAFLTTWGEFGAGARDHLHPYYDRIEGTPVFWLDEEYVQKNIIGVAVTNLK